MKSKPDTTKMWEAANAVSAELDKLFDRLDRAFEAKHEQRTGEAVRVKTLKVRLKGRWSLFWYFLKRAVECLFRGQTVFSYRQTNRIAKCPVCQNEIDPDVCWCGSPFNGRYARHDGHAPIPVGCTCHYASQTNSSET